MSTSINISITNVHICCIKHEETDIRKRNELQNEAVRVWDEARFQNDRRRNSPDDFAALQMPDTVFTHNFLITAASISETCYQF